MARRRKILHNESLDSLLDTMTNVVGILIILMAMTQIGVGDVVRRYLSDSGVPLAEVSEQAVNVARAEQDELTRVLRGVKAQWDDLEARYVAQQASLNQIRRAIDDLRARLKDGFTGEVDAREIGTIVEQRLREKAQLDAEVARLTAEMAKLKAALDATPEHEPVQPKIVRLPNPRPAPERKKPIVFFCRDDKVYYVDEPYLIKIGESGIARAAPRRDAEGHVDCQQIVSYFAQRPFGNANFRLRVEVHNFSPHLVLERTESSGETIAEIQNPDSEFRRVLRRYSPSSRYIRFSVWPESFGSYVAARDVVDRLGWDAGWQPQTRADEWKIPLPDEITCIGRPRFVEPSTTVTPPPVQPGQGPDDTPPDFGSGDNAAEIDIVD